MKLEHEMALAGPQSGADRQSFPAQLFAIGDDLEYEQMLSRLGKIGKELRQQGV